MNSKISRSSKINVNVNCRTLTALCTPSLFSRVLLSVLFKFSHFSKVNDSVSTVSTKYLYVLRVAA